MRVTEMKQTPNNLNEYDFDALPHSAYVRRVTVEKLFACSPATVWRWVQQGLLPKPHKRGGLTLWNVGELRDTLNITKAPRHV